MKTAELVGVTLDWAVATCEGYEVRTHSSRRYPYEKAHVTARRCGDEDWLRYCPSEAWMQGGPIIERERICVGWSYPRRITDKGTQAVAQFFEAPHSALQVHRAFGPTLLIAAMRCYVASRFGDEVNFPERPV